jgi:hypothetical protein
LRRLLRAKDRMDAASHEEWPVWRLACVSGVSEAHFAPHHQREVYMFVLPYVAKSRSQERRTA